MTRLLTSTALAAALGLTSLAAPAAAQTYELQNVFPLSVPSIGPSPQHWAERVHALTGGEVTINVHGSGDVVPGSEVFNAVSTGVLDMGFDWIGYWSGQIPVANLVGSMPFGPEPEVLLAWMYRGGGLEIIQEAYEPFGVHILPCHLVVGEAGGWFNREINTPEDLQGLNMRIAGLGGRALQRLGVNAQLIPAGEIYVSLERGRIEATEFSAPQLDVGFGFQNITDYYYFPGWHQPSSWDSIIINADVWAGIAPEHQRAMEEACLANITAQLIDQLHAQAEALEEIEAAGVEIRRFPDEVLAAMREASAEVLAEEAQNDELFARALDSLTTYMGRVGRFTELQTLPR